jgi:hypothetical protein
MLAEMPDGVLVINLGPTRTLGAFMAFPFIRAGSEKASSKEMRFTILVALHWF